MTALILAGGKATRMGDICREIPKAMLPIAGKPFLVWLSDFLVRKGLKVMIGTGHLSNTIKAEFQQDKWLNNVFCLDEPSVLGTGGAIKFLAMAASTRDVLIFNGDTILELNIDALWSFHMSHGYPMTQVVTTRSAQNEGSIIINSIGEVVGFYEGHETLIPELSEGMKSMSSTGCYLARRDFVIQYFPNEPASLETEVMPKVCNDKLVRAFIIPESSLFIDFGTPIRYDEALLIGDDIAKIYSQ